MTYWYEYGHRSLTLPRTFALIRYNKTNDMTAVIAAAMPLHNLVRAKQVQTYSVEQINAVINALEKALEPFLALNWFAMIPQKDPWWAVIRPYYEFYSPVIQDPTNGIDLWAFAFDTESVHRSSTQNMILTNLAILRTIPIPTDLNALEEFLASATFNAIPLRRDYNSLVISLGIGEITYASAFDHLWSFIRKHEHKNELVKRLEEEILDGANVCANGKLARLMNVVEGYLDGITTENRKELFQNRMAIISKMGVKRRRREAKKAFKEYGIPEGEQGPWLEALE